MEADFAVASGKSALSLPELRPLINLASVTLCFKTEGPAWLFKTSKGTGTSHVFKDCQELHRRPGRTRRWQQ